MVLEIRLGDIVRLKKAHPCGNDEWVIVRVGVQNKEGIENIRQFFHYEEKY